MFTLLKTLHVLFAVLLVGPLTMIPMTALRSIRRRDGAAVAGAARQTMIYGLGSLLVFVLGFGIVGVKSERFSMGDPWITISMTLYVIALVLVLALVLPGLRGASKLIEAGVQDTQRLTGATPPPVAGVGGTDEPTPALESGDGEDAGPTSGAAVPAGSAAGSDQATQLRSEPTLTATATDLATKQKLDSLYGRTAAGAGLVTLLFIVIVVLMVVQPFS